MKMGRVVKTVNNKVNSGGVKKITPKVSRKRLVMQQRRINSLLIEKHCEEEKNRDLFNSLKAEKMLTASLKKESFDWQRKYHESTMTLNRFKVKQTEIVQTLSACLGEIDSIYPQMVAFSGSVTRNKIRMNNLLASLRSSDYNIFPRQFHENGKENDSPERRTEKPMRQRVGPMVKGFLITKPKIMLERVIMPQPQDQEPVSPDLPNTVVNPLTPIPEEVDHEEDVRFRHISVRPRRKLGRSWRVNKDKNDSAKKSIAKRTDKDHSIGTVYEEDSSDLESNLAVASHLEPVLRLKDVSRMLKNSSLLKVDSTRTGDSEIGVGGNSTSRPSKIESHQAAVRAPEDPLEGSSWMFNGNHKHRGNFCSALQNQRQSSYQLHSDSSDDENENIVQNRKSNTPPINSLLINQNFVKNSSLSSRTSCDTTARSPVSEPDSTSNVEAPLSNNSSIKHSVENNLMKSIPSSTPINSFRKLNNTLNKSSSQNRFPLGKEQINSNSLTVSPSIVHSGPNMFSSTNHSISPNKRLSIFCGDCSPIPSEALGKRVRKKKINLYPGEDDVNLFSKRKFSKGRNSIRKISEGNRSNSTKEKKSKSTKSSSPTKSVIPKKKSKTEPSTTKRKSSPTALTKKGGVSTATVSASKVKKNISVDKQSLSKTKNSSSKRSTIASRTSSTAGMDSLLDNRESIRPKRSKLNVCYKESPLNTKQRRP